MINIILKMYKNYDPTYTPRTKTLFIHKPIPVDVFLGIRDIINFYEVDIKNIVVGRW